MESSLNVIQTFHISGSHLTLTAIEIAQIDVQQSAGGPDFTFSSEPYCRRVSLSLPIITSFLFSPLFSRLTSICMSRFILGLLSISLDEGSSQLQTSRWETLRFATIAQTFAGDVGVLDERLLEDDGEVDESTELSNHGQEASVDDVTAESDV